MVRQWYVVANRRMIHVFASVYVEDDYLTSRILPKPMLQVNNVDLQQEDQSNLQSEERFERLQ